MSAPWIGQVIAAVSLVMMLVTLAWMVFMLCKWLAVIFRESPRCMDLRAARAHDNGMDLMRMARQMRAQAATEQRGLQRDQLLAWARRCESAASDHLACINAITLDSLQATGLKEPVYLGEFRPNRRAYKVFAFPSVLRRGGRHG